MRHTSQDAAMKFHFATLLFGLTFAATCATFNDQRPVKQFTEIFRRDLKTPCIPSIDSCMCVHPKSRWLNCGGWVPVVLPEVGLAFVEGAELAQRGGPWFAPAHPATLQASADHRFAGRLHFARADVPAVRHILRIVHPVQVAADVAQQLTMAFPCHGRRS